VPVPADSGITIVPMTDQHAEQVLAIYAQGIAEGNATFETETPAWPAFRAGRLDDQSFVAVADARVVGWVAASVVSSRPAYRGVVEHSVYVNTEARGRGVGGRLLRRLIASTEATGIWTIQSALFPENTASLALHRSLGFRVVGTRERIARQHGRWRDTVLVERRSPLVD
jgi:L-amino acid N-acyltransferase YncA